MTERIHSALHDFVRDPVVGAQTLRDLKQEDIGAFRDAAFSVLFEGGAGLEQKDILTLVRESGVDFLPKLLDPNLNLAQAVAAAKTISDSETGVDVRLVRMLIHPSVAENGRSVSRVLDILEELSAIPRLLPILMQVYKVAPKQVRARIATMIGKAHRSEEWVEQRMTDPDSRVRANIVELYIGQHSALAVNAFRRGIGDPAARVMGNAALGMYYAASAPTLHFLGAQMAEHESANHRAAAAWAMGQTRDLRFRHVLGRLIRDSDPMVRRQAIRGLTILRREETSNTEEQSAPVAIRPILQLRSSSGNTHYRLELRRMEDGGGQGKARAVPVTGVRPIEIHTYENNEPVLDYELHPCETRDGDGNYDLVFPSRFPGREPEATFRYRAHSHDYKPA
ncbi:MAG: HEAT repeat domain-containing protein [Acidobacteria bacterium]|nr:HEAT repeat domain-containing protein [Acidobacteriota bacterium]